MISYRGQRLYMHRLAYEEAYGPIPPNTEVCHRCDNPACVRPDHLFLGTQADNMADMIAKGRNDTSGITQHRGEQHPLARLTESSVREIRTLVNGGLSHAKVAKRFSVSRPTVTAIMSGRIWSHVT